jgi:hypothetical protein
MPRTISHYHEFLQALQKSFVEKYSFNCEPGLKEVLQNPRLILAINHSTPLSWLPAMSVLAVEFQNAGGSERISRGVVDRWFYSNPITKFVAQYLTHSDRPHSFEEILSDFSQGQLNDLLVFPEGANAFFGDVHEVQEFRSARFIEISILADAPILVVAHRGSEGWSFPLHIPAEWTSYISPFSKFFAEKLSTGNALNFPLFPRKISNFEMKCCLYRPTLTASDLSTDLSQRRAQLMAEAQLVRKSMCEMMEE